ncbi:MAG: hypothetical protein ACREQ9_19155 [Candidatus Binatia bacterium]
MRTFALLAALSAAVLLGGQSAYAEHGTSSPCCAANSDEVACNAEAFPSAPSGSGCQEADAGSCIGGSASPGGVQGCVCVGGVCASGNPADPTTIGVEDGNGLGMYSMCTDNAVAGCTAGGTTH